MKFVEGWPEELTNQLKILWEEGMTASQIGKALGKTRNAVLGKTHRMELVPRIVLRRQSVPRAPRVYVPKVIEPVILAPALLLEDGLNVTVMTINDRMCRWPIGHPGEEAFHFCGNGPHGRYPYCEAHCRIAYQPIKPREYKEPDRIRRQ